MKHIVHRCGIERLVGKWNDFSIVYFVIDRQIGMESIGDVDRSYLTRGEVIRKALGDNTGSAAHIKNPLMRPAPDVLKRSKHGGLIARLEIAVDTRIPAQCRGDSIEGYWFLGLLAAHVPAFRQRII